MSGIHIHYLGHSAVCVQNSEGEQFLIDPFLNGNPRCPTPDIKFEKLVAICLTHGHADHVGDTVRLAKHYGCKVYATFELASLLAREGVPEGNLVFMNKGGCVRHGDTVVSLSQAFHSSSFDASDGQTYYAGEAASILLEFSAGPCLFHAGDTMLFSDLELIGKRRKPDLAFLPIGDCYTMGPKDAAEAARMLGARVVIPIHYATMPTLTGTPEAFKEALQESDIEVQVLDPGEEFSLE